MVGSVCGGVVRGAVLLVVVVASCLVVVVALVGYACCVDLVGRGVGEYRRRVGGGCGYIQIPG